MKYIIHPNCMRYSATALLLLFSTVMSLAKGPTQDLSKTVIAFEINHSSLKEAFRKIESETRFFFTFKTNDVVSYADLNFSSPHISVDKLLKILLTGTDLTYQQMDNNIIIKKMGSLNDSPQRVESITRICLLRQAFMGK